MAEKTGVGHQYRNEEKAINQCNSHLEDAFNSIYGLGNPDIDTLKWDIAKLQNRCAELSYAANQRFKQNQD